MYFFSPNHVQIISACYPPSSTLLSSGPEYLPNSQELSKLTYFAANRPGKLTKLGAELLKRTKTDCRKAEAGNTRSRASLLITLNIFKAVATECRRDISLLSHSLMASVALAMSALPLDLEVSARVATLFTTWTTYTNGHLIGVDNVVTKDYHSALLSFSHLSSIESKSDDHEMRNRTRLVGLAALRGAVNSDALDHDASQFRIQVSAIMRPLLVTLLEAPLSVLDVQALQVKQQPLSPYLSEFRRRPAIERRAPSIQVHIDGDSGPSTKDVTNACLHVLFPLFDQSNSAQISHIMKAVFGVLDELQGWGKHDHCCWFAQKASEWSQYQYRYAVPTCLVEQLLESQDTHVPSLRHTALATMITTVFKSPTPLINLSTSDIVSNLVTLVLRRVSINPHDSLLPALVRCIASLGTHVYYSDQIQDLAGELINRLVMVELYGVVPLKEPQEKTRSQAIRCLLASMLELLKAASKEEPFSRGQDRSRHELLMTSQSHITSFSSLADGRLPRRSRVSPDTWQDSLTLLCDPDYSVRADYSDALVTYLRSEIQQKGDTTAMDGVKRTRPPAEGPLQQVKNVTLLLYGDSATRFLNALHAYLYTLATTTSLGLAHGASSSEQNLSAPTLNVQPATPSDSAHQVSDVMEHSSPSPSQATRRSISGPPRAQKMSIVRRLLTNVPCYISRGTLACASDYSHMLSILAAAHERLPIRGLLTGVPMLLALDSATAVDQPDAATLQRARLIKEVVARVWAVIAKMWGLSSLRDLAANAIATMPRKSRLPSLPSLKGNSFHPPREPIPIEFGNPSDSNYTWSGVDTEEALSIIVSAQNVQEATGLDRSGLLRRFSNQWTPESALNESNEKPPNYDILRGEGISPLLKISPALMQGENVSLQSLARSARGVGVTDLREALEGRGDMSNPALAKPASISTLEHVSSLSGGDSLANKLKATTLAHVRKRAVSRGHGEVRDVLNKLGIGRQNGTSLLKASFPSVQSANRVTPSIPPYSA